MTDFVFRAEASTETLLRLPPREAVEWVRRSVDRGGRVLSIEPLVGGMSHGNHLIRVETARSTHDVVLRRWVRPDWHETDPEFSPAQEAATYGLLASSSASAPCLLATDTEPRECDVPAILLTRMLGTRPTKPANMSSFVVWSRGGRRVSFRLPIGRRSSGRPRPLLGYSRGSRFPAGPALGDQSPTCQTRRLRRPRRGDSSLGSAVDCQDVRLASRISRLRARPFA